MSCNSVLSSTDFKFKHPETKEHDGFCSACRGLCFETNEYKEYVGGDDSLIFRVYHGEILTTTGLSSGSDDVECHWINEEGENDYE